MTGLPLRHRARLSLAAAVVLLLAGGARAQDRRFARIPDPTETSGRRLALVVGNNAYPQAPLRNAVNDARGIGAALRGIGFDTTELVDVNIDTLDRGVEAFLARVQKDDVALFYFSGHGLEIKGENFLLPVDFAADTELQVKRHALSANDLLARLEERSPRVRILILDACRNNPFGGSRALGTGLAKLEGLGTLVAFATAPGQTASDNGGAANGLFTAHLIEALRTPGLRAAELFRRVRQAVYEGSKGAQVPFLSDGLIQDFVFTQPQAPPRTAPAAPTTPARVSASSSSLRWAYVTVPAGADAQRVRQTAADLRTATASALVFAAADAGFAYARPSFDATPAFQSRLNGQAGALPQVPAAERVAFINVQQLASGSALGKTYTQRVADLTATRQKTLQALTDRLDAERKALEATRTLLSAAGIADLSREIEQLERDSAREAQDAQAAVQALQDQLQTDFQNQLMPVLTQLATDLNLDVVFSSVDAALAWARSDLDLTPALLAAFEAKTAGRPVLTPPAPVRPVTRVAAIDVQQIAAQSALGRQSTAQVAALTSAKQQQLKTLQDRLDADKKKLDAGAPVMNDAAVAQLTREIDQLQRDLQRGREDAQREVQKLQSDLEASFFKVLTPLVQQVSQDAGVDLLFTTGDGILAADGALDLTPTVVQRLDAQPRR